MQEKQLHIISFDNPFPPDYGGAIDVFYKIKALHKRGYSIYLHCFVDSRELVCENLQSITKKVWIYKKDRNPFFMFSSIPFAVKSRFRNDLIANIQSIDAPVLFEGLQTTMLLNKLGLNKRNLFLRLHNFESNYFRGTAKSEKNWFRKLLYLSESMKYTRYERIMERFEKVFTLSVHEHEMVQRRFGNSVYIPVFHGNDQIEELSEFGNFCLYHGDLRLADNKKAAEFLINAFRKTDVKFVIASSNGESFCRKHINNAANISFSKIKHHQQLNDLLSSAHVNVMVSFQQSGTKLKLVNSLFKSRHCLINKNMVDDETILSLCEIADSEPDFIAKINRLMLEPYKASSRKMALEEILNDDKNALKISKSIVNV